MIAENAHRERIVGRPFADRILAAPSVWSRIIRLNSPEKHGKELECCKYDRVENLLSLLILLL